MSKNEPITLTKNEWKLYERASHKLKLIHERDARAWDKLQERHHANYREQRRDVVRVLHLGQSPTVVAQLKQDGALHLDDVVEPSE